jgi:hypothetical protein
VRLIDLEKSVARELGGLSYAEYLGAMWVIASATESLYLRYLTPQARQIMDQTLAAVRIAVGGDSARAAQLGAALQAGWSPVLADPDLDGPGGLFPTLFMFELLAKELAGSAPRQESAKLVTATVADYAGDGAPVRPGLVRVSRDQAPEESSPAVRLLRKFSQVAVLSAAPTPHGGRLSPEQIQRTVFGS